MKRRIASILGILFFRSGLYRLFFRNKAVIVLFHRVDDRLRGNAISCSCAEFRAFAGFFQRFFSVVSLGELVGKLECGKDISRHLVITFDDGYRDNRSTAAVELKRQRLPACFFVATEFVGSQRVAWWDGDNGIESEWMSWDDVRALRADGFEVGAHTMNHVDLGVVQGEEAEAEILGSKERLERELGTAVSLFSYPYGQVHQFTEENRDIVRRSGFRCCLSAFWGVVSSETDVFHIKRTPVSPWYRSPFQLGFDLMRTPVSEPHLRARQMNPKVDQR